MVTLHSLAANFGDIGYTSLANNFEPDEAKQKFENVGPDLRFKLFGTQIVLYQQKLDRNHEFLQIMTGEELDFFIQHTKSKTFTGRGTGLAVKGPHTCYLFNSCIYCKYLLIHVFASGNFFISFVYTFL